MTPSKQEITDEIHYAQQYGLVNVFFQYKSSHHHEVMTIHHDGNQSEMTFGVYSPLFNVVVPLYKDRLVGK